MSHRFQLTMLTLVLATGCAIPDEGDLLEDRLTERGTLAVSNGLTAQDCNTPELQQPFGTCNLPVDAVSCSRDWNVSTEPTHDYACFGFSEHLQLCQNCNVLNINDWDLCKNKQYMDCLMAGYINQYGPLCFVTKPAEIPFSSSDIRVTAREACYYYHRTGMWPPQQCPTAAACCQCTGGTDYLGNPVSAWCGGSVCGADFQTYTCDLGQWRATGTACTGDCQCTGGTDYLGNPVSAACGQSVCGADFQLYNCTQSQWVATGTACGTGTKLTVSVGFGAMPAWSSSWNASWGSAATWSVPSGGQTGSFLNATRSGEGSSAKVKVYNITPYTTYTISIYMKGSSSSVNYWVETGFRLGNRTAQDFDQNSAAWTLVKKFQNVTGQNGNGNVWTKYSVTFSSGANSQISVGFKSGSLGGAAPAARWDTLTIQ